MHARQMTRPAPARDKVEKRGQRLGALMADVAEFGDKLVAQTLVNDGHGERPRLVCKQVTIVCCLQV